MCTTLRFGQRIEPHASTQRRSAKMHRWVPQMRFRKTFQKVINIMLKMTASTRRIQRNFRIAVWRSQEKTAFEKAKGSGKERKREKKIIIKKIQYQNIY